MDIKRLLEIEEALHERLPNGAYDENAQVVVTCQICNGAIDDHKGNCIVPMVYELLDEVKEMLGAEKFAERAWSGNS